MTSKEALKKINQYWADINVIGKSDIVIINEDWEEVYKDLEVLEMLKKWVIVNETHDDLFPYELKLRKGYISNKSSLVLSKEEFNLIKEWLEK